MLPAMHAPGGQQDPIQVLRSEFRRHLELFYGRLQLAPPYHSVEKAITHLTAALNALPHDERARVAADPSLQWAHFTRAFADSGLSQKHRGIIAGLAKSGPRADLPDEYQQFLALFR